MLSGSVATSTRIRKPELGSATSNYDHRCFTSETTQDLSVPIARIGIPCSNLSGKSCSNTTRVRHEFVSSTGGGMRATSTLPDAHVIRLVPLVMLRCASLKKTDYRQATVLTKLRTFLSPLDTPLPSRLPRFSRQNTWLLSQEITSPSPSGAALGRDR